MAGHGKLSTQYFQCDHCGDEGSFDRHEGNRQQEGCNAELCVGCIHDCSDCNGEFCPHHIVANAVDEISYTATYACLTCRAQRERLDRNAA